MKIYEIYIALLFLVMAVIGCDDHNRGEHDPCVELAATAECPCNYDQVSFECWMGDSNTFVACDNENCTPLQGIDGCGLSQSIQMSSVSIEVIADDFNLQCRFSNPASVPICGPEFFFSNLSDEQFATCLCRLANYANQATQAGVTIIGSGPPFSCQPSTSPDPSCIPLGEGNCSAGHECCDDEAECVDSVCCLPNGTKNCQDGSQCCSGDCEACFDPPECIQN